MLVGASRGGGLVWKVRLWISRLVVVTDCNGGQARCTGWLRHGGGALYYSLLFTKRRSEVKFKGL